MIFDDELKKLNRFYELKELVEDINQLPTFFVGDQLTLSQAKYKLNLFSKDEENLQYLSINSWDSVKNKLKKYFKAPRQLGRGYQLFWDILSEVEAYRYLIEEIGCEAVEFIPESNRRRTPDLTGSIKDNKILCEVKTINWSDDRLSAISSGSGSDVYIKLPKEFFNKFDDSFSIANSQLNSCSSNRGDMKIIYMHINFDYSYDYVSDYLFQIIKHTSNRICLKKEFIDYDQSARVVFELKDNDK